MFWNRRIVQESLDVSRRPEIEDSFISELRSSHGHQRQPEESGDGCDSPAFLRVALIGHERLQADMLGRLLTMRGYQVEILESRPARDIATSAIGFDLLLVDLSGSMRLAGRSLIEEMRKQVKDIPAILVLTEEVTEDELANLYDAGADDVMFKPLRIAVFLARWQALARRVYPNMERSDDVVKVGKYVMDFMARKLTLNGSPIKLSSREFDLASYLFRNVGKLLSRSALEKAIWGRELGIDSKTLDTHIYRLRLKLRLQPENGLQLVSVYAQGFRLIQVLA